MKVNLSLKLLLLILGLIFLGLAALNVSSKYVNFGWAGCFCIGLALLTAI